MRIEKVSDWIFQDHRFLDLAGYVDPGDDVGLDVCKQGVARLNKPRPVSQRRNVVVSDGSGLSCWSAFKHPAGSASIVSPSASARMRCPSALGCESVG